jgi:hypothetical protein
MFILFFIPFFIPFIPAFTVEMWQVRLSLDTGHKKSVDSTRYNTLFIQDVLCLQEAIKAAVN